MLPFTGGLLLREGGDENDINGLRNRVLLKAMDPISYLCSAFQIQ